MFIQRPYHPHRHPGCGMPKPRIARKHLFLLNPHPTKDEDSEDDKEAKNRLPSLREKQNRRCRSQKHFQRVSAHLNETEKGTVIAMDVPGFGVDDLKISLEDHVLSLFGKRRNRLKNTFVIHKRFVLTDSIYEETSIEADLSEGVLEIKIEKKPEPQPRMIPISLKEETPGKNETRNSDTDIKLSFVSKEDKEEITTSSPSPPSSSVSTAAVVAGAEKVLVESISEEEEEEALDDTELFEIDNHKISDEKVQEGTVKEDDSAWEEVAQSIP